MKALRDNEHIQYQYLKTLKTLSYFVKYVESYQNDNNELKICLSEVTNYELLGELKGGVDPAGADEHWKTAGTALTRIRSSFFDKNQSVKTLFIGAAIEKAMAQEMYEQTLDGTLTMCANLTKPSQVTEICSLLTQL